MVQEANMKTTNTCPRCNSTKIISDAKVISKGYHPGLTKVSVIRHPHAMIFEDPEEADLKAWICGNCGYTEIYADDPQRLFDAHVEAQAERKKNG